MYNLIPVVQNRPGCDKKGFQVLSGAIGDELKC